MRIGVVLGETDGTLTAARAASLGVFAVATPPGERTFAVSAAQVAVATSDVRVVVPVTLGADHPVTLAEDLLVLDDLSGGRIVALVTAGELDGDAAAEDLALLRACLSGRPVVHRGRRWQVPAGLPGHEAPGRVQVTPAPTQVEIPVWLDGQITTAGADRALPHLARTPDELDAASYVRPGTDRLSGELDDDRELVIAWAEAGATHLLLASDELGRDLPAIARHLAPEVAMPDFPRLVAQTLTPPAWPGPARYVDHQR